MASKKKVNILGTDYNWIETTKHPILENTDGACGTYDKTIVIEVDLFPNSVPINGNIEGERQEKSRCIKRHEIIHAYFNESGVRAYGNDERLVDWLTVMLPKIFETFKEMDCI